MIEGAFKSMKHDHFFRELAENSTEVRDRFTFSAPLLFLGLIAERLFLASYMEDLLRHRNQVLKEIAESDRWQRFLPRS